jgi:hypothetical protein
MKKEITVHENACSLMSAFIFIHITIFYFNNI